MKKVSMDSCFSEKEREEIRIQFGARLRAKRQAQNISQEELALRSGLHRTYVGSVERGERNLSLENIYVFAKTLDCNPQELLPNMPTKKRK
jgi:transcriptional regulator with XRE-family HTH domain